MSIMDKFKPLKKEKINEDIPGVRVSTTFNSLDHTPLVMMNDGVNICAEACASCWDSKLPTEWKDKAIYLSKRTKIGHTSVIEHANVVILIGVRNNVPEIKEELIEFLSSNRFMHSCYKASYDPSFSGYLGYLLIGGQYRAFSDLFLFMENQENYFLNIIKKAVYKYIPSAAMVDVIELGLLDQSKFDDVRLSEVIHDCSIYDGTTFTINPKLDILNCDNIYTLAKNIEANCPEPWLFTWNDLLDFCTISVKFKNMSRIITQQLCRHRNAITQESQRYVDYSKAKFNSPAEFVPEYDSKHKYNISFGSTKITATLQELGDMMVGVYQQLIDKTNIRSREFALKKEDARGYLPNNTACGKIYITFTFRNFIKFLQLREDPHAQAEIREYGIALGKWFREVYPDMKEDIFDCLLPACKQTGYFSKPICSSNHGISNDITQEIIDTLEEHIKNYDESKEDKEVVEEEKITLRQGEM